MKKLKIAKETIRQLVAAELGMVNGGLPAESGGVPCITYFCPSNPDICDYTRALQCQMPTDPLATCIPYP